MINTKLILIEGIPGAGKSVTASALSDQIENYGLACDCFLEWDDDHPIPIGEEHEIREIIATSRTRASDVQQHWQTIVAEARLQDKITVIESRFWQTSLMFMYGAGASEAEISKVQKQVSQVISELNPVLIHFAFDDEMKVIDAIKAERGPQWESHLTAAFEAQVLAKNWGLKGDALWQKLFESWRPVAQTLFEEVTFKKVQIREPHDDWDMAMQKIANFLESP